MKKKLDEELAKASTSLRIQQAIHEVTGFMLPDYQAKTRKEDLVFARMIFSWHAKRSGLSPDDIAGILHKNRSMIYHYFNHFPDECRFNPNFRQMAAAVDQLLKQNQWH